ncbi:serine hydrolase domain-containing protein [Microbacterium sp. TNHR37B]|uniref:serine hydrolase domain-containing protein n=1 Tax=Microbacterium sp. TNHR37B TaxID=1775956 RepID=UPI0007B307D2|nr:serine hydrolase [Microbacterium sp. TNHR37B]KZE89920.1 hypothetical protein AVP41_02722 [Microbacterium sp. TNHR37B]
MVSDSSPEAHGIPSRALLRLLDTLETSGLDPHAIVVARRDGEGGWNSVFECAWQPYDLTRPALVYSVSKTFTSLAIGLLEAEGMLSLDDSVGDLLGLPNPHGLTVRHLLTMNTGHDAEQIDALRFDVRKLLTQTPAATPGTRFAYNSDATYALSCIVTALTGERLTDYLRPRLLEPLGIGQRWMKPAFGVEQGFSGFHITVGDLVRVSTLLADGGRHDGEQLVASSYVGELSQPWSDTRDPAQSPEEAAANDWGLGYGYQVWRSTVGFRLDGAYGQFGVIDPERGIVIAYQGSTLETQRTLRAFWELMSDVSDLPLDEDDDAFEQLRERAHTVDSWDARDALAPAPDGAIDTTDWRLDDADGGWRLALPSGDSVAVASDSWTAALLPLPAPAQPGPAVVASPEVEEGTAVPIAVRGEAHADGVRVHLVVTASPHRLLLRRDGAGALHAAWHTVPLQGPGLETLAVPEWVDEQA